MREEIKSKYAGVYYVIAPGPGGRGSEKKFYIKYRRGGRGSKEIHELLGSESQGWTEKRASDERARRKAGISQSNSEKRQALMDQQKSADSAATYGQVWERYLDANNEKRSIRVVDRSRHELHVAPLLNARDVRSIRTSDIADVRKSAEKKGLSPQTVKHVVGLIRRTLRWGVKYGLCKMPEDLIIDMPMVDNRKIETMTEKQLAAFLRTLDEEPDQVGASALRLALVTGMRKSAILALRWTDIDLEAGRESVTLRGENAKSGRTAKLPLNKDALEVIRQLPRDSEYLFPGRFGGRREGITRMARRVRDKAGLPPDFRLFHGLRHVFASILVTKGVDMYTLQILLTHGSPAMTQIYAHLSDEHLRNAVNLANLLGKKNEEN